jgi:hypothetical protein
MLLIGRMERDRDDRLAVLLAAGRKKADDQKGDREYATPLEKVHVRVKPKHREKRGVKGKAGLPLSLSPGLVGRFLPHPRLAPQLVPFHASREWNCEQRRHLPGAGR